MNLVMYETWHKNTLQHFDDVHKVWDYLEMFWFMFEFMGHFSAIGPFQKQIGAFLEFQIMLGSTWHLLRGLFRILPTFLINFLNK